MLVLYCFLQDVNLTVLSKVLNDSNEYTTPFRKFLIRQKVAINCRLNITITHCENYCCRGLLLQMNIICSTVLIGVI